MNLDSSNDAAWVMMGDLNVPEKWAGITSTSWKMLKGNLNKGTDVGELHYSFPAIPTKDYFIKMQIDHVFSTLPTANFHYHFEKIPGSDHYPLIVQF